MNDPRPAPSPARSALASAVAATPLLRELYDPERHQGPFVIGGDPAAWGAVARDLDARRVSRLAFHDRRWRAPRLVFARRPVVHDALFDDESRRTFASLVRARVEADAGYIRVSHHREYDHPIVRACPGDVVIDGGAYTGLSALRFLFRMRGRGTVVALEPSVASYRRLARLKLPGLVPLCVGAWHESTTLSFQEGGASGRIGQGGTSTVHVSPIDAIARDLALPRVDLIKLDVEGAEAAALDGAREILARDRPKLQVSIYHRRDDLFELPLRLMAELRGYRFYLGHHGFYRTETDLYAIPEERVR